MATTPFQNINRVVQFAVSDSKQFIVDNLGDLTEVDEDEVKTVMDESFSSRDLDENFEELYYTVFGACLDCYIENMDVGED